MLLAGVLTIEQKLRLGIGSDNPHIQIAVMYRTLTDDRRPQNLTDRDRDLITELLFKVANDALRWAGWMKVFVRYPALQLPLGRALANVPDTAIDGYVNSIWLYPKLAGRDPGRRSVAECLREFRANASPERRKALWACAHKRWLEWDFSRADPDQHLTAITWSDLDYALVGYASECLDEARRKAAMTSIRAEADTLEHHWHGSFTDILTAWYRLVSRFQPYAHAFSVLTNGEDWLPEGRNYWPFDPSQNRYLVMMYNVTSPVAATE